MNQRDCVAQLPEHWTSIPMVIDSIAQCRYGLRVNITNIMSVFLLEPRWYKQSVSGGGVEKRGWGERQGQKYSY